MQAPRAATPPSPNEGGADSGLLSAATSAAGETPVGLAAIAALLLITLAGVLAVRRSRRAKGTTTSR